MVEMIYKILNLCIKPFQMIEYNIVVVPFSMLTALLIILIFIRLIKGEYNK